LVDGETALVLILVLVIAFEIGVNDIDEPLVDFDRGLNDLPGVVEERAELNDLPGVEDSVEVNDLLAVVLLEELMAFDLDFH
jgi:hypothetical protein